MQDAKTCKSCEFGFQLVTTNDIVSCGPIEKVVIPECTQVSDTQPFVCLECNSPYYPLGDECKLVNKNIQGCAMYK